MKIGDMVRLNTSATNKGLPWQQEVGIVIDIVKKPGYSGGCATVNFSGTIVDYAVKKLRVIDENR